MLKPQTLKEAYEFAESEEKKVEAIRRRSYIRTNFSSKPMQNRNGGRLNSDHKTITDFKGSKTTTEFKKG